MINHLRIRNFKSWQDTGDVRLGKLTGVFGTNSSGKTSLLQFLLMLRQTAESPDRQQVLNLGGGYATIDLGTYRDVIYDHQTENALQFEVGWQPSEPFLLPIHYSESLPEWDNVTLEGSRSEYARRIQFSARVSENKDLLQAERFAYAFRAGDGDPFVFGMEQKTDGDSSDSKEPEYRLIHDGYDAKRTRGRGWPLPEPVKCYGFPDRAVAYYQNTEFLPGLTLAFEDLFHGVEYLGPLRDLPARQYSWSGERPQDVGHAGEASIAALLASRARNLTVHRGKGLKVRTVEEHVASWLKELDLISSFRLVPIAEGLKTYEVRVKTSASSPEVALLDVGFGVSQVLPVLVLCFYAEPGSTLIFEQPEIHLHPRAQAGLADVFIDAIKLRGVQIIVESHSEHFLRRLQLRIAEEEMPADDVALYFVEKPRKVSRLRELDVDEYGNIRDWPENFFGDEMGDLAAMTKAAIRRKREVAA